MKFETSRLILRPFTMDDTKTLHQLATDPYLAKWTQSFSPSFSIQQAEKWLRRVVMETGQKVNITLSVRLKTRDILIGAVSLKLKQNDIAEIGYWLGAGYRGKGYCTEAVQHIIHVAFSEYHLIRIIGYCDVSNRRSANVMIRSKMRLSHSQPSTALINDQNILLQTYEVSPPL